MPNTFLASDTHLGHRLMVETRPWATLEEHDEAIIENWNKVVGKNDVVWHLGDVVMNHNKLSLAARLNGRKKLVMGNHDTHPISEYLEIFEEVRGSKELAGMILTHIPIHPWQLKRWGTNVHGHLHKTVVMLSVDENELLYEDHGCIETHYAPIPEPDPRYICVSMEQINYTPISLEEVREKIISNRHSTFM